MALVNSRLTGAEQFWEQIHSGSIFSDPFDAFHNNEAIYAASAAGDVALIEKSLPGFFKNAKRVLDYGCGTGRLLAPLAQKRPDIRFVGVDISAKALRAASRVVRPLKNAALAKMADGLMPEIEDASFDAILAWRVVERMPRNLFHVTLREWNRVLKSGGQIAFNAPKFVGPVAKSKVIDEPLDGDYFSSRRYTREMLELVLPVHGFDLVSVAEIGAQGDPLAASGGGGSLEPATLVVTARKARLPAHASDEHAKLGLCNICGHDTFISGPIGRASRSRTWPRCAQCRSLQRARILRRVTQRLPEAMLASRNALQFSPEPSYQQERFKSFKVSIYEGENHMDLHALPVEAGSFDWIICNHVLEHVEHDDVAMRELAKACHRDGVLQLAVPGPLVMSKTREFGRAVPEDHFHWRSYGSNFPETFRTRVPGFYALSVHDIDHVTGVTDVFYFFSRNRKTLEEIATSQAEAAAVRMYVDEPAEEPLARAAAS